jgi:hypothetical protein
MRASGAKLSEFRPGGGAKLSSGGAKLVCTAIDFGELSRAADLGLRIERRAGLPNPSGSPQ